MTNNSRRLYNYVIKQKRLILWGVLATLLMSLVELATGAMLKFITNLVDKFSGSLSDGVLKTAKLPIKYNVKNPITHERIEFFNTTLKGSHEIFKGMLYLCGAFLVLYFVFALFNYLRRVYMNAATQLILKDFKSDIYKKLLRLPYGFFQQNKTGDLVSRITYDVTTLNEIIDLLIEVARALIYIVVFIPVMFVMSWQLALFTILYFPIAVVFIEFLTRKIKRVSKHLTDNVGDYTAYLEEKINGIKLVKSFRKEQDEERQFESLITENFKHNLKYIKLKFALNPGSDFLGMIVLSIVYVFYCYKLSNGQADLGDFVFFLYLVNTAYKPVKKVAEAWGTLHMALVSTKKIFILLDEPEEVDVATIHTPEVLNELSILDLCFAYPDDKRSVLVDFNLSVKKGDVVAVIGKTGAGKTTLLNILAGFYQPTKGRITINQKEVSGGGWLRSNVAYLGTDSLMINATIRQNMEYGACVLTPDKAVEFARFVGLKDESELQWVIGKDGVNLSAGQQQKVAFIRAILTRPQVVIFDEVFGSLESDDVDYIMSYCQQAGCILFVVSRNVLVLNYANVKCVL